MRLTDRIMDVATRAGYRIENDDDVHKAILAYSSAVALIEQRRPRSRKLGRNDPCPCGSGRKYKRLATEQAVREMKQKRDLLAGQLAYIIVDF